MDEIKLVDLSAVKAEKIIELMNNERVGKQLPLLGQAFTADHCQAFLRAKKQLWDDHGFGPRAILINGEFAGWGGLQPEHGDADFALVLHPRFWGWGRKIFNKVKDEAFNHMNFGSITALLPPGRPNSRAITRLGFAEEGQLTLDGETFLKFRLHNPKHHV